jgi:hypothetical protein
MLAIAEHQRQSDSMKFMQNHFGSMQAEMEMLRREVTSLRTENQQLRSDNAALSSQQGRAPAQGMSDPYAADQFGRGQPPRPELPPLRSLQGGGTAPAGPESMTGVQYDHPRTNGYRAPERF